MPFLSVLLPVYNGEELVADAIESVINQPCKDLELVIMDDGSNDRTHEICNSYAEKDARIHIYQHKNVGLGANRNMGYPYLTGECTIFLDHDDLILRGFFTEEMKDFIHNCFENEIQVIVPARLKTDYELKNAYLEKVPELGIVPGGDFPSWKIEHEFATLIYQTTLLKSNNIYFAETRPEMESIFRHKAVYVANKVLFTNELYFAIRRENPKSITSTWNYYNIAPIRIHAYEALCTWHKEYDASDQTVYEHANQYLGQIVAEYFVEMTLKWKVAVDSPVNTDEIIEKYSQKVPEEFHIEDRTIIKSFIKNKLLFLINCYLHRKLKMRIHNKKVTKIPKNFSYYEEQVSLFHQYIKKINDMSLRKTGE